MLRLLHHKHICDNFFLLAWHNFPVSAPHLVVTFCLVSAHSSKLVASSLIGWTAARIYLFTDFLISLLYI